MKLSEEGWSAVRRRTGVANTTIQKIVRGDWPWDNPQHWNRKNRARSWATGLGRVARYLDLDLQLVLDEVGFPSDPELRDVANRANDVGVSTCAPNELVLGAITPCSGIESVYEALVEPLVKSTFPEASLRVVPFTIRGLIGGLTSSPPSAAMGIGLVATPGRRLQGLALIPLPGLFWRLGLLHLQHEPIPIGQVRPGATPSEAADASGLAAPESVAISWELIRTEQDSEIDYLVIQDDVGQTHMGGFMMRPVAVLKPSSQARPDQESVVVDSLVGYVKNHPKRQFVFVSDECTCSGLEAALVRRFGDDKVVATNCNADPSCDAPRYPICLAVPEGSPLAGVLEEAFADCCYFNPRRMALLFADLFDPNPGGVVFDGRQLSSRFDRFKCELKDIAGDDRSLVFDPIGEVGAARRPLESNVH